MISSKSNLKLNPNKGIPGTLRQGVLSVSQAKCMALDLKSAPAARIPTKTRFEYTRNTALFQGSGPDFTVDTKTKSGGSIASPPEW